MMSNRTYVITQHEVQLLVTLRAQILTRTNFGEFGEFCQNSPKLVLAKIKKKRVDFIYNEEKNQRN